MNFIFVNYNFYFNYMFNFYLIKVLFCSWFGIYWLLICNDIVVMVFFLNVVFFMIYLWKFIILLVIKKCEYWEYFFVFRINWLVLIFRVIIYKLLLDIMVLIIYRWRWNIKDFFDCVILFIYFKIYDYKDVFFVNYL